MQEPKLSNMNASKRILLYIHGACDYDIMFPEKKSEGGLELIGVEIRRIRTVGYVFYYGGALMS